MRKVYQCDKCLKTYTLEVDATDCENSHRDSKDFEITFVSYEGSSLKDIPSKVRINFSDRYGDFAMYTLLQHGYKGL